MPGTSAVPDMSLRELADVMVCLALLAEILDVDLARAVSAKIGHLEARNRRAGLTS